MDDQIPSIGVALLIIVIVLVAIFPFVTRKARPRCQECKSRKIGVEKIPLGMRTSGFCGGGEGGGYSAVQMHYEIKHRCNNCQAQWTVTTTETR